MTQLSQLLYKFSFPSTPSIADTLYSHSKPSISSCSQLQPNQQVLSGKMKHEDGIEVYLKPCLRKLDRWMPSEIGERDRARTEECRAREAEIEMLEKKAKLYRFPELNIHDSNPLRKRCYIPANWTCYEVIIRFSETFDMFSANSIRFGISSNSIESELNGQTIEQSSRIVAQHFRVSEKTADHWYGSASLFLQTSDGNRRAFASVSMSC